MHRADLLDQYMASHQHLIHQWKAHYFARVADEDLSPALVGLLFVLNRCKTLQSKHIAQELHITPGAVAQFLDALEQHGYIERTTDKIDRRVSHITLSPEGTKKVKKLEEIRHKLFTEIAANLTDEEIATSIALNKKLIDSM